ncbi:1-phosphatidylinositol 4-kinase [Heracleum sosnowskyi]|uniref:1-phosphatidylinositol 4-kinase n=1 Tax=Heracleum sosnowskyi TaxID=360622 RepID=A0AAD8H6Y1_9APIA|nr:1-phosphatidylinositol 4-kinase [Heracleum sosnowskyi]
MSMTVFSSSVSGETQGGNRMQWKPAGRRRVFVQTETGCVLGMDLDRGDNAHTVKRKLQIALNVPVEESSLTFGDMVLKNDLSAIRNDSPLLLTRNLMHRSSSTPCISPIRADLQQGDQSGPIEILIHCKSLIKMEQLVEEIIKGMKIGVDPIPVYSGLGGAYYFRNSKGGSVAIVKPTDEEPFAPNNPKGFVGKALGQPGLKHSVRVGETGFREVAAYILDYDHFANVPPTALVKITHSIFNVNDGVNGNKSQSKKLVSKIASFQQFIPHDFDASDHGTSNFPVAAVHRIGILDIRILNTDRHAGNLLVRELNGEGRFGEVEIVPIDHGLCLPESLEDPYFEWIHWAQASIPFSKYELEYIEKLDPFQDSEMLRRELPMIRETCLRVLILCTIFLKEASAFGLCLAEIGEMMSREFHRGEEEPSELELVCIEARRLMSEREVLPPKADAEDTEFQFDIDCKELGHDCTSDVFMIQPSLQFGVGGDFNSHSPLSKLEESVQEEEEEEVEGKKQDKEIAAEMPNVSKLSVSLENTSLYGKSKYLKSSGRKTAVEQLPASVRFVEFSDMKDEEWALFLVKFQELLDSTFAQRKSVTLGQKQRQRLGTSCQF